MRSCFTTRELADLLHVDVWRIQRLFETGAVDEPSRFAGKRVISGDQIPSIVSNLRSRGWLSSSQKGAQDDQPH
jgi:hypothetical protein